MGEDGSVRRGRGGVRFRDRDELARLSIAIAGTGIGLACLIAPRLTARVAGISGSPDAIWLLRLFGVRDLCLGFAFLRARDRRTLRVLAEVMVVAQLGDLTVSTVAALRGGLSRRALAAVWAGAPPTIASALRLHRS